MNMGSGLIACHLVMGYGWSRKIPVPRCCLLQRSRLLRTRVRRQQFQELRHTRQLARRVFDPSKSQRPREFSVCQYNLILAGDRASWSRSRWSLGTRSMSRRTKEWYRRNAQWHFVSRKGVFHTSRRAPRRPWTWSKRLKVGEPSMTTKACICRIECVRNWLCIPSHC